MNVSDQPVTAKLRLDAHIYGFSNDRIEATPLTDADSEKSFTLPVVSQRDMSFPAKSAIAWELN